MKKIILVFCIILAACSAVLAAVVNPIAINHFTVKENPFAVGEIAILATDTADRIQENVNGSFVFSVNGLEDTLKFEKGTAFYRHKIERSTFLYVKHVNDAGTHGRLYYIYKNEKLNIIHISWIVLIAIPLGLILLAYMFKRFIIVAIIIFAIFLFFNYHNNLSVPTFFESIVDGLKGLF